MSYRPRQALVHAGSDFETNRAITFSIPFTWEWDWTNKYSYEFTTSSRIATSSSYSGVGANADVYLGATRSIVTGLAKSVSVISDSLWQARQTAYKGGAIKLLAQGTDADGHKFYLVTGEKSVIGSAIDNTFIYSQKYILESDGHKFYLVTGEKSVIGSAIDNTFIYSQKYILESCWRTSPIGKRHRL